MAFIQSLDLLPKETRQLIAYLSELRNELVHDATKYSFNFSIWISEMDTNKRKNFEKCLSSQVPLNASLKISSQTFHKMPPKILRSFIMGAAFGIVDVLVSRKFDAMQKQLEAELKRLEGLTESYEAGLKSTPKEL